MGHQGEAWGSFVDVKVNALERLRYEAARRKRKGIVLLSSVTDPYQPIERKFELTRGALFILSKHRFPVSILTKSDLVLRDLDIIRKFDVCEVGFTITALGDEVRKAFEPGASSVEARLSALESLSDSGIPTWAFIGPVLPYLTDNGLDTLLNRLVGCVNRIIVDRLNVKAGNISDIRNVLKKNYMEMKPHFESALKGDSTYYNDFKRKIEKMCRERSIPLEVVY
jgi:DNA repair photolyase